MNGGATRGRNGIAQSQIPVSPPSFLLSPPLELHQEERCVNFYCCITSQHKLCGLKNTCLSSDNLQTRNRNRLDWVFCSGLTGKNEGVACVFGRICFQAHSGCGRIYFLEAVGLRSHLCWLQAAGTLCSWKPLTFFPTWPCLSSKQQWCVMFF